MLFSVLIGESYEPPAKLGMKYELICKPHGRIGNGFSEIFVYFFGQLAFISEQFLFFS